MHVHGKIYTSCPNHVKFICNYCESRSLLIVKRFELPLGLDERRHAVGFTLLGRRMRATVVWPSALMKQVLSPAKLIAPCRLPVLGIFGDMLSVFLVLRSQILSEWKNVDIPLLSLSTLPERSVLCREHFCVFRSISTHLGIAPPDILTPSYSIYTGNIWAKVLAFSSRAERSVNRSLRGRGFPDISVERNTVSRPSWQ